MKRLHLELKTGKNLLFLDCVYAPACTTERTRSLAKPMCTFDKVLNQRVDWVAWASIQIYGAPDTIDDACTTSSGQYTWCTWPFCEKMSGVCELLLIMLPSKVCPQCQAVVPPRLKVCKSCEHVC